MSMKRAWRTPVLNMDQTLIIKEIFENSFLTWNSDEGIKNIINVTIIRVLIGRMGRKKVILLLLFQILTLAEIASTLVTNFPHHPFILTFRLFVSAMT